MSLLPVEPAWRLAERSRGAALARSPACGPSRPSASSAASPSAASRSSPSTRRRGRRRRPLPAPLRRAARPAASCSTPPRTPCISCAAASTASATAAGVALADLDIQVITAPTLRLDLDADRRSLAETVAKLQPRLLILDPFVRLHRIDENASGEVAPLLAYLRELQRRHGVAVLVVHHAKKGAGSARAGQALRGSSEFHAWGDSNLYLRRDGDDLALTVEHRAAAVTDAHHHRTCSTRASPRSRARRLPVNPHAAPSSLDERITTALAEAAHRCHSPNCAPTAASAPPPSTSGSLP